MKRRSLFILVLIFLGFVLALKADVPGQNKEFSGSEMLARTEFLNKAVDQSFTIKMTLIDKDGKDNSRNMKIWTKGKHSRLIRFTYPADIKGVGFLVQNADLPNEMMYLYLPAYKKTKRIAGSAKSESFMDSDFSFSDIGSTNYEEHYVPKRLPDENGKYKLELTKKPGSAIEHDMLVMLIDQTSFVPVRVEFYQKRKLGNEEKLEKRKIMESESVENIGNYWLPLKITMEDIKKKHKTVMEFKDVKLDTGLSNNMFSLRNLEK